MRKKPPRGGVQLLISSGPFLHHCAITVVRYGLLVNDYQGIGLVEHPLEVFGVGGIEGIHSMS